jgi:phage gpG-like protein
MLKLFGSSSKNYSKDGRSLSKRGMGKLVNKRPLIGEGLSLASQFAWNADADSLTVFSTVKYAAIQQQGGKKGQFPNLWGDIPARPFLPVRPGDQSLYPDERQSILDAINAHLQQAWKG